MLCTDPLGLLGTNPILSPSPRFLTESTLYSLWHRPEHSQRKICGKVQFIRPNRCQAPCEGMKDKNSRKREMVLPKASEQGGPCPRMAILCPLLTRTKNLPSCHAQPQATAWPSASPRRAASGSLARHSVRTDLPHASCLSFLVILATELQWPPSEI